MNYLGISAFYHDSAATLVTAEGVAGAIQEERLTRTKGDRSFPHLAIGRLLEGANLTPLDVDGIGFYEFPKRKFRRIMATQVGEAPMGWRQTLDVARKLTSESKELQHALAVGGFQAPVEFFGHHESHAASAFFPSPFESAAIVTVDGVGEWATTTIAKGASTDISPVSQMRFPHSIGLLYATFTAYCGFKVNSGEYKLMGLAPFGTPKFADEIRREIVRIHNDGSITLNMKYFDYTRGLNMYSQMLCAFFGQPARQPDDHLTEFHCDVAASIQAVLTEIMRKLVAHALAVTSEKNLCLAGGVALNCVANGALFDLVPASQIFVQPAAGDAGGSLGAALLCLRNRNQASGSLLRQPMSNAFLGTSYSPSQINSALEDLGVEATRIDDAGLLAREASSRLTSGRVVGWFQGRMEFGPRALGARSILADARDTDMQRRLNVKIKHRESFRPFAPVVLEEFASDWFDWPSDAPSPFMLFTAPVASERLVPADNSFPKSGLLTEWVSRARSEIPAVTHVDGSARLQTVSEQDPLHSLLKVFQEETGVPVLVNTSFNVRGEPIVESPHDAIMCFLTTDMDSLVIGPFIADKENQPPTTISEARQNAREWDLD